MIKQKKGFAYWVGLTVQATIVLGVIFFILVIAWTFGTGVANHVWR